jgi:hypothetical protein
VGSVDRRVRGSRHAPAYQASKAFISTYLTVCVTRPSAAACRSWSPTSFPAGVGDGAGEIAFWKAPGVAAGQIAAAIRHRRPRHVTCRWRPIAWLLAVVPDWVFHRCCDEWGFPACRQE